MEEEEEDDSQRRAGWRWRLMDWAVKRVVVPRLRPTRHTCRREGWRRRRRSWDMGAFFGGGLSLVLIVK